MTSVAIVLGSVRPGRAGEQVVRWIEEQARQVDGVATVFFDLRDYNLPLFAEEMPPSMQAPELPEAVRLRTNIEAQDAVLFVGCIYNPLEVVVGNDREFVDMLHARSLALERQTQASADSLLDECMCISRTERNDGVKIANIPALAKHVDMNDNLDRIALLLDGKEELC